MTQGNPGPPWNGQLGQYQPPPSQFTPIPQYGVVPYGYPHYRELVATDQRVNTAEVVLAWIFTAVTLGYFLPWAIAATRGKSNSAAIGVLNFFLGWTFIGWVAALVMACGSHHPVTAASATMWINNPPPQQQLPMYHGYQLPAQQPIPLPSTGHPRLSSSPAPFDGVSDVYNPRSLQ